MPAATRNHKSLAVLICGKTTGKTHAENGDYIDIYNRFLRTSLRYHTGSNATSNRINESLNGTSNWQFTLDAYNVFERQELPDEEKLNSLDAILITGSRACTFLPILSPSSTHPCASSDLAVWASIDSSYLPSFLVSCASMNGIG